MLSPVGVEIERRGICHVAARVVRHDGHVIAYFVLVRPTFNGTKGLAHRHIGRPGEAGIGAVRVEQLRIGIVRSIARVVPHSIEPSIRGD